MHATERRRMMDRFSPRRRSAPKQNDPCLALAQRLLVTSLERMRPALHRLAREALFFQEKFAGPW
jgi:hypothetical protein